MTDIIHGKIYCNEVKMKRILKQIKKFKKDDMFVEVNELSKEESQTLLSNLKNSEFNSIIRKQVNLGPRFDSKNAIFEVKLLGPKQGK